MTPSLLTILIFITIKTAFVLFFVYQLWKFRLTNLDNQVKMQIELIERLEILLEEIRDKKDI
jgi:heme/copper-type cytochrome/quinol oxidase subunit 2